MATRAAPGSDLELSASSPAFTGSRRALAVGRGPVCPSVCPSVQQAAWRCPPDPSRRRNSGVSSCRPGAAGGRQGSILQAEAAGIPLKAAKYDQVSTLVFNGRSPLINPGPQGAVQSLPPPLSPKYSFH